MWRTSIHPATQRQFDVERGWAEFQEFKHQPEPFLSAVVATMMSADLTLEEACRLERDSQGKEENHEGTWAALDANAGCARLAPGEDDPG